MLLRDKLEDFQLTDANGKTKKLTKGRWQSYVRRSKEYEGWGSSLQADFGHDLVRFLEESQLLDEEVATLAGARKVLAAKTPAAEPYETEVVKDGKDEVVLKAIHRKSGLARTHTLPEALFASNDYRKFVEVHGTLLKQVGRPPFEVSLGSRSEEAVSFVDLHRAVMDLAKHGINFSRYKGLGEMNSEELRETTMDPDSRTLQRVTIDDAAEMATQEIFSMLMGDEVEPRRAFIERNAKEVTNLDV
jgi:DNA gyrase subunit B